MNEDELSYHIISAAIEVHRTLGGPGLLESVYEEALVWELLERGFAVERQKQLPIIYKDTVLADPLRLDVIVNNRVIVECKAVVTYHAIFEADVLKAHEPEISPRHQLWRSTRQIRHSSRGQQLMNPFTYLSQRLQSWLHPITHPLCAFLALPLRLCVESFGSKIFQWRPSFLRPLTQLLCALLCPSLRLCVESFHSNISQHLHAFLRPLTKPLCALLCPSLRLCVKSFSSSSKANPCLS